MSTEIFQIKVDLDSLHLVEGRAGPRVEGVVFAQFSLRPFPSERWVDDPMAILAGWLPAATQLVRGADLTEELWFLDGPYKIDLARSGSSVEITAVKAKADGGEPVASARLEAGAFLDSLVAAGEAVALWASGHGHRSRDLEMLTAALAEATRSL